MKIPDIHPAPKDRKLVGGIHATSYRLDKLGLLTPKIRIQGLDYHSYAQLIEALSQLEEAPHV